MLTVVTDSFPRPNRWGISNETRQIAVSPHELLREAITVGHPDYSTVLGGGAVGALAEITWKLGVTVMTIQQTPSFLTHTNRFLNLDPSEKRGATYQMGLTINKLVAWRLFGIRWLHHVDVYASRLGIRFRAGRSRPDLVGCDSRSHWAVFESKGRFSPPDAEAKRKAKVQSRRIVQVAGVAPSLCASCFAFFRKSGNSHLPQLQCRIEDPKPNGKSQEPDIFTLNTSRNELLQLYYKPFMQLFVSQQGERRENRMVWKSGELDLTLQMEVSLFEAIQRGDDTKIVSILERTNPHEISSSVSGDGMELVLGRTWTDDLLSER